MAASFTIYGNPGSTSTNIVRLMLADANIDYEFVSLDLLKAEHKSPGYLARNPYGRVPVLTMKADNFTLYESRAICAFLAATYSLPYLPPASDVQGRALFDQAAFAEACHFAPAAGAMSFEKFLKPILDLEMDVGIVNAKRRELERHFDTLEGILGGQGYMVGNEFGLVDVFYMPMVDRMMKCGEGGLVTNRKNVNAWWERCMGRPAVEKFLGEMSTLEEAKRKVLATKS